VEENIEFFSGVYGVRGRAARNAGKRFWRWRDDGAAQGHDAAADRRVKQRLGWLRDSA